MFQTFKDRMMLGEFNTYEMNEIFEILAKFVFGFETYSQTTLNLKPFGLANHFRSTLKRMSNQLIWYALTTLRDFVLFGERNTAQVNPFDREIICLLRNRRFPFWKTTTEQPPTFEEVVESMKWEIRKRARHSLLNVHFDRMTSLQDIEAELTINILTTYRFYVFGFGGVVPTESAFYSLLRKGLETGALDFVKGIRVEARQTNCYPISWEDKKANLLSTPDLVTWQPETLTEFMENLYHETTEKEAQEKFESKTTH